MILTPITRSDPAMLGPAEEEIMNLLAARIQGIRDQVRRNAMLYSSSGRAQPKSNFIFHLKV